MQARVWIKKNRVSIIITTEDTGTVSHQCEKTSSHLKSRYNYRITRRHPVPLLMEVREKNDHTTCN